MPYTIDDLYSSVNDIYSQYDSGKVNLEVTNKIMARCCQEFLNYVKTLESKSHEVSQFMLRY